MRLRQVLGFTLAELLIALLILGVIATFTIPKVLQSQQSNEWNSAAKEAISMISGAYQAYQSGNTATGVTTMGDLTPYMNYVAIDTTSDIDRNYSVAGSAPCNGGGTEHICLRLHSGALMRLWKPACFFSNGSLNAMVFMYDPDGKLTSTDAFGDGKRLTFYLYFNGRISDIGNITPNTTTATSSACIATSTSQPDPTLVPPWFSWD